jgi:hypothetical protein
MVCNICIKTSSVDEPRLGKAGNFVTRSCCKNDHFILVQVGGLEQELRIPKFGTLNLKGIIMAQAVQSW